jgi:hypothetical protein
LGGRLLASEPHLQVDGLIPSSLWEMVVHSGADGYGGMVDGAGNPWSSERGCNILLRVHLPVSRPPEESRDGEWLSAEGICRYGITLDPIRPYLWQRSGGSYVCCWHTIGTPVTYNQGRVLPHEHGGPSSQSLVVDSRGHVWVAHGHHGNTTVGHLAPKTGR